MVRSADHVYAGAEEPDFAAYALASAEEKLADGDVNPEAAASLNRVAQVTPELVMAVWSAVSASS